MKKSFSFGLLTLFVLLTPALVHAAPAYYDDFTVSVTADPSADANGTVNAKVGDTIQFTRAFSKEVGIGTSHWLYSPNILSCDEGGDPSIQCKVIGKGDGTMAYSITVMTDWIETKSTYQDFSAGIVNVHITDGSGTPYKPSIVQGPPDLVIVVSKAKLVTHKVKGVAKKQYKVPVLIKNVGSGDVSGKVYYSAMSEAATFPILVTKGGIMAGKSKKVFFYLDTNEKGNIYTFKVDPESKIVEFDETNNSATIVVGK
jgi:hypothetical protein